jgi:hypothetical protein
MNTVYKENAAVYGVWHMAYNEIEGRGGGGRLQNNLLEEPSRRVRRFLASRRLQR